MISHLIQIISKTNNRKKDVHAAAVKTSFLVVLLSLIVFPMLIVVAFNASRVLLPNLANFQAPQGTITLSQNTAERRIPLNNSIPAFLNFSVPSIPSVTYSDILILAAIIIVSIVFVRAFGIIRTWTNPFSSKASGLLEERKEIAAILDETVRKLNLGSNYRDTVLKCYKLIEQTMEIRSAVSGKTLTAAEFKDVVSKKLKFDSPYLSRATALFEVARYSEIDITEQDATEAKECLSELSKELKSSSAISIDSSNN